MKARLILGAHPLILFYRVITNVAENHPTKAPKARFLDGSTHLNERLLFTFQDCT